MKAGGKVAVLALLVMGCATARSVECRVHGGPTWREVKSEHFHVSGNLSAKQTEQLARDFEQLLSAIRWAIDDAGALGTVEAIAVGPGQLKPFGYVDVLGLVPGDGRLLIIMENEDRFSKGGRLPETATHELTHLIARHAMPKLPRWLSEGLATYVETITFQGPTTVKLGTGQWFYQDTVDREGPADAERLWAWGTEKEPEGPMLSHLYATAWAYVHYLSNHERARFNALLAALRGGEEPRGAFERIFPRFAQEQSVAAVRHVDGGKFVAMTLTIPAAPQVPKATEVPPGQVHLLRSEIYTYAFRTPDAERRERVERELRLADALGAQPSRPVAPPVPFLIPPPAGAQGYEEARRKVVAANAMRTHVLQLPIGAPSARDMLSKVEHLDGLDDDPLVSARLELERAIFGEEGASELPSPEGRNEVRHALMLAALVRGDCPRVQQLVDVLKAMRKPDSVDEWLERAIAGSAAACAPRATAAADCPKGSEGLSKDAILKTIRGSSQLVQVSFEMAMGLDARMKELTVDAVFNISPTGAVRRVVIETAPAQPLFVALFQRLVSSMVFPPPCGGGDVSVHFPWVLKAAPP